MNAESIPTQRQLLLDELASLRHALTDATAQQQLLQSRAATPAMSIAARQQEWKRCQLERVSIAGKMSALRRKIAQLDRPAHDEAQAWRDAMRKRIDEQLAWREVLKVSLLTHQGEHLSVWGNDLGKQTERIKTAEKRLQDCDEEIKAMQAELALSSSEVSA